MKTSGENLDKIFKEIDLLIKKYNESAEKNGSVKVRELWRYNQGEDLFFIVITDRGSSSILEDVLESLESNTEGVKIVSWPCDYRKSEEWGFDERIFKYKFS